MKKKLEEGNTALEHMRNMGGDWFAYENHALDSSMLGHLKFLQCGPVSTFKHPPARLPDKLGEINWAYIFHGIVNKVTGEINEVPYAEVTPDEVHGDESKDGSDSGVNSGGEVD